MLIDKLNRPLEKPIMTVSAYSIQGKRNHMEDYFDIGYQLKPCDQRRSYEWPYEYFYFGIFDGHGGSEAAKFAKQNLLKFITQQKDFWSTDDDDVMQAIRKGYADTHTAMKKVMSSWNRTNRILPSTAGTTASVLFIKNGKFYTGHVGDSRIVISKENFETKQWIAHQLTKDHKPESDQELERIKRAGGEVRDKIGVHRVVWRRPVLTCYVESALMEGPESSDYEDFKDLIHTYPVSETLVDNYQTIPFLAIARSLGDFWSLNPHSGQYVVSPEPDVSCRHIHPDDKCILLATDGLWNVINSIQAIRFLQELNISKKGCRQYYPDEYFATDNYYDVAGVDSENHAQSLVYFAYQIWERRRLRSDNITVVTAMLHNILSGFHKYKTHTRSASLASGKDLQPDLSKLNPVQIGETNAFFEKIVSNTEAQFNITPLESSEEDVWRQLEKFLVLPPTVFEQKYDFNHFDNHPKLTYPKNYVRLSNAACRRIRVSPSSDTYIYIKQLSDDPADEVYGPTRIGKSGKEVRDSSAQATQSIHDFGQPWDQLFDENDETDVSSSEDEQKVDTVIEGDDKNKVDLAATEIIKSPKKEDKSIPQLRCLLNCTPTLRRSKRSANLSVSENAKRKVQIASNASLTKSKRRKSHPVRCNMAPA